MDLELTPQEDESKKLWMQSPEKERLRGNKKAILRYVNNCQEEEGIPVILAGPMTRSNR